MKASSYLKKSQLSLAVIVLTASFHANSASLPEPTDAFIYQLKESLVKVSTATKSGGHGFGTGVAITKDHIVTNCHVIANASGVSASRWGEEFPPVALQADWKHDVCILRFEWANFKPVVIGDSNTLAYEQPVISISMPSDSPAPYVALSTIKALYPMDDSAVIRSEAAFAIGASGSPLFDYDGKLIGISTFKSPGRKAYFYNMSVKWVKDLLQTPEVKLNSPHDLPFWDAPEDTRPYFMQVVLPFQNQRWQDLQKVAYNWTASEPGNVEAWYYLGMATLGLGDKANADKDFQTALKLKNNHPATLRALALMAHQQGNEAEVEKIRLTLKDVSTDMLQSLDDELKAPEAVN
ncbi:MAG TPA: trypsin-like peptidase domain-containing protein [Methylotenera sp.]|nr:trypsin-like peptidase domain-containing protein [Methylotenera sp.]